MIYVKVYDMGLRIDLRTILSALLIPTQSRLLMKESQELRKLYHLVHYHTRTLITYYSFRLLLLKALHRREIKKLQISLGTLPAEEKSRLKKEDKNKINKENGKLLEEYLLCALSRQTEMIDIFYQTQKSKNIVSW